MSERKRELKPAAKSGLTPCLHLVRLYVQLWALLRFLSRTSLRTVELLVDRMRTGPHALRNWCCQPPTATLGFSLGGNPPVCPEPEATFDSP